MPQPAQQLLHRVLLLWISILSIIQVVFITLYFTSGPHHKCLNCSTTATAQSMSSKANEQPLLNSDNNLRLGKGKMLTFTFEGNGDNGTIKWKPRIDKEGIFSVNQGVLTIDEDGYYYLNLRVTLKECKSLDPMVRVIHRSDSGRMVTLVEGSINGSACTTGPLVRVTKLSKGGTLAITINIKRPEINDKEHLTHLDIIYLAQE